VDSSDWETDTGKARDSDTEEDEPAAEPDDNALPESAAALAALQHPLPGAFPSNGGDATTPPSTLATNFQAQETVV
jgi:hypothetical protein